MTLKVVPLKSVNGVSFGMKREQVREIFGPLSSSFKKASSSHSKTDDFGFCHVSYNSDDECEAIEIFDDTSVEINGVMVFPGEFEKVSKKIRGLKGDGMGSFLNKAQSIGVSVSDGKAKSILFAVKGYYNNSTMESVLAEWENARESKLTTSELAKFYSEAVITIRDIIIPNFFIQESAAIKEFLESPTLTEYEIRSLDFPYKEMGEYDVGVRQYLDATMEKVVTKSSNEDFLLNLVQDIEKVKDNSCSFVDQLFEDELNPCHRVPVEEAVSCLEALIDLQEQLPLMLESGQEVEQILGTCTNDQIRDQLAELYYKTESNFLLEYTKECFHIYDIIMGRTKSSEDSGSVQLL